MSSMSARSLISVLCLNTWMRFSGMRGIWMYHSPIPMPPIVGGLPTTTIGTVTTKFDADVPVPIGVVTVIGPVVAPTGTVAVMIESLTNVNTAGIPLNDTSVTPVKLCPVIVTNCPTGPEGGAKLKMLGGCGGPGGPSGRSRSSRLTQAIHFAHMSL